MPCNEHLGKVIHNSKASLARGSFLVFGIREKAAHRRLGGTEVSLGNAFLNGKFHRRENAK